LDQPPSKSAKKSKSLTVETFWENLEKIIDSLFRETCHNIGWSPVARPLALALQARPSASGPSGLSPAPVPAERTSEHTAGHGVTKLLMFIDVN